MTKKFPTFASHAEVSCFNCGGDLGDYWGKSGHAPGRGEYVQACEKCRMRTWYDLSAPRLRKASLLEPNKRANWEYDPDTARPRYIRN